MKENQIKQILDQIGERAFPDEPDAWAVIQSKMKIEKKMNKQTSARYTKYLKYAAGIATALIITLILLFTVPKNQAIAEPLRNLFNPSAERSPTLEPPPNHLTITIEEGDTLSLIAHTYGVTLEELLESNPDLDANLLVTGDQLFIPKLSAPETEDCSGIFYTVQAGDTILGITSKLNVTVEEIIAANPGFDPNLLAIGDELSINSCPEDTDIMAHGRWAAKTEFGQIIFTVNNAMPGRTRLSQISFVFNDWTCGDLTLNTGFTDGSGYTLDDQNGLKYLTQVYPIGIPPINLTGRYDPKTQIFYGTWEINTATTKCIGAWAAIHQK